MQLDIVGVITHLAQQTRVQQSVAIIGALSDMMRHLRKSIHCSLDDSNLGSEIIQWNQKYRMQVDECLVQLTIKVTTNSPLLKMILVNSVIGCETWMFNSFVLTGYNGFCRLQMQVLLLIPWLCCWKTCLILLLWPEP